MFNFLKQPKSPVPFFAAASITMLVMLPVFIYFLNRILTEHSAGNIAKNPVARQQNQYFSDNLFNTDDPFITKVMELKDLIDGPIVNGADPSIGNADAGVTVVEFSDFECDFCRKREKALSRIMKEYEGKIRLVWKDYPIDDPEAASYQAAVAARCGAEQNKFWPYHNLLFEKNGNFSKRIFLEIARELNLNLKQFEKCLESDEAKGSVDDNIVEANALGINGVPFIFINKQKVSGEAGLDELRKVIEAELSKQK